MSAATLNVLCERVRPELACLGDAGAPLVTVLRFVEAAGAGRESDVLADPGFALDVLTAADPGTDPALVGRVLDFLRTREGAGQGRNGSGLAIRQSAVKLADAVASYEAGPLAMMAKGTGRTYRTWTRRLAAAHPDVDPRQFTAGDLRDLIAHHVLARRNESDRRRAGTDGEENAVPPTERCGATSFRRAGWTRTWRWSSTSRLARTPTGVRSAPTKRCWSVTWPSRPVGTLCWTRSP